MSVKLTISGDFCVTSSYVSKVLLSDEIMTLFSQSDINIVNLECPINNVNNDIKIIKNGPHLQTTDEIIKYLKALNIGAITLANNHILDFGNVGLMNTLKKCKENNIITTGVGKNLKEASDHFLVPNIPINIGRCEARPPGAQRRSDRGHHGQWTGFCRGRRPARQQVHHAHPRGAGRVRIQADVRAHEGRARCGEGARRRPREPRGAAACPIPGVGLRRQRAKPPRAH